MTHAKLEIPLTYQGGKQRIAKQIIDIISERNSIEGKTFWDLCCGSGAVTIECLNRELPFVGYKMLDWSVWGDFWKSIGNGTFLPEMFEIYIKNLPDDKRQIEKHIKHMTQESPYDGVFLSHVYRFLLIQSNAFGGTSVWIEDGKWKKAGGYRSFWMPTATSNRRSHVNPMMPMPETLYKRVETLSAKLYDFVEGINDNVEKYVEFPENSIIYIDPPYNETTRYGKDFDIHEWINETVQKSKARIYVSEQEPLGKVAFLISEKRKKGNISGNGSGVEEWLTEFN